LLKQWQFVLLMALAVAGLALAITNIVMFTGNREAQNEFSTRAQYIQQSQQIEPLHQSIVRNLAEVSAKTNDPQIARLLTAQGITFTVTPPQAPANTAAPQVDSKGKSK
jgi:hypothetical protein